MTVGDQSPTELEQALLLLHDLRGLLVLDLTMAQSAPFEHCKVIATSWPSGPSPPTPHTRLAILVRFEHWALLRPLLTTELALLATKGVEAVVCYEELRWQEWFLTGEIVHDVERVLHTLRALVERPRNEGTDPLPLSHWKIVLATAASLLDGSSPEALCELTRIALDCGANAEALEFANEAGRVADKGSVLECRALRLLGMAMMRQGLASGAQAVEDALNLAVAMGAKLEAAEALNELGLHDLQRGKRHAAEFRLQAAVALCPSEHAELWTALRDGLAQNPPTN
ncbi:MAG: tetratricopeptide repeat protein [Solirubrobacterales bacterium]